MGPSEHRLAVGPEHRRRSGKRTQPRNVAITSPPNRMRSQIREGIRARGKATLEEELLLGLIAGHVRDDATAMYFISELEGDYRAMDNPGVWVAIS